MVGKIMMLDWRATLSLAKWVFIAYPAVVFCFGFITSQMLVVPISMWLSALYSFKAFQVEEEVGLSHLYLTLPVSRSQIVKARYGFALIMMVFGIIMGLAVMPAVRHFSRSMWYIQFEGHVAVAAVGALCFAVLILSMYPLLFKLGYQKGKIIGLFIPVGVFYAAIFGYYIYMISGSRNITLDFVSFASRNVIAVSGGLLVLAVLIFLLSYVLSLRAYTRRDL
ncbi:MAG: ABC-2 transporter permease [Defluviitaleaceae bacterium]|nr:ABC-2 transporter permease [Defluviitaleaceae bacterium]